MSELNHWTFVAEYGGGLISDTIEASTIGHARRIALLVMVEHGWLSMNMIMWCPADPRAPIDDDNWLAAISGLGPVSLYRRHGANHAHGRNDASMVALASGRWARIAARWTGRAA